jgi:hypothetical protein
MINLLVGKDAHKEAISDTLLRVRVYYELDRFFNTLGSSTFRYVPVQLAGETQSRGATKQNRGWAACPSPEGRRRLSALGL